MVYRRTDMSIVSGTHGHLETYSPRIKEDYCNLSLKENTLIAQSQQ